MKKVIFLLAVMMFSIPNIAKADKIVILDEYNNLKQEIYTSNAAQTVYTQPQITYVQPQQVIVQQPVQTREVVITRSVPRPGYYYDSPASSFLAGFTGAVIGGAIFHHGRHHHGGGHHHGFRHHGHRH